MTWYQLYDVIQAQAEEEAMPVTGRAAPPVACPNCGEPLIPGNSLDPVIELFCRFDGWSFPQDWVQPVSNSFG